MEDNDWIEGEEEGDEWIEGEEDDEWIENGENDAWMEEEEDNEWMEDDWEDWVEEEELLIENEDPSEEEIEKLRSRVSIHRNLKSLENLCLAKVANNIKLNALNTTHTIQLDQDPCNLLQLLPPVVMRALPKFLQARRDKFSPRITSFLVNRNTESLQVNASVQHGKNGWSLEDQMSLLESIQAKGKNITELDLVLGFPCTPQLASTLHSLGTKLTQLRLSYAGTDDAVLAVIGSCCPQLRKFKSDTTLVTDAGIGFLCVSDDTHGKCKKLTHLSMSLSGRITVDGLVTALKNLPELLVLSSNHLYSAILKYSVEQNGPPLKLKYMNVGVAEKQFEAASMAKIVSAVPDTRKLNVCSSDLQNIDPFLKLTDIAELSFGFFCSLSSYSITSLLINSGSKLTKLGLTVRNVIDVTIIGHYCTNLISLDLAVDYPSQFEHTLVPFVHFSKLKNTRIGNAYSGLPDIVMKCILGATSLQDVNMCCPVSDSVFGWLVEEARSHEQVFSNLIHFKFESDISSLRAKQILCLAPKLQTVFIKVYQTKIEAQNFIQRHGLTHCRVL